jgi:hypothetical protein
MENTLDGMGSDEESRAGEISIQLESLVSEYHDGNLSIPEFARLHCEINEANENLKMYNKYLKIMY